MRGGGFRRAVQPPRHGVIERVDQERGLAAARDAGDAGEQADRDFGIDVFQVVAARVQHLELLARIGRPPLRRRDFLAAGEIVAGQRVLGLEDVVERALGDDLAAVDAGAGAHVHQMIGAADRFLVVLDDDDGVAEIAQPFQRFQQPRIVALVQADRGLVEHIEHARQPRADLRGEANALALAARERARCARQRQVIEPHVDQERQPLADFLEHAAGDFVVLLGEVLGQFLEPAPRRAHRKLGRLADVLVVHAHRQRLGLQAIAVAGGAGDGGEIALHVLARQIAFGLAPAPLEIVHHAFERLFGFEAAHAVVIDEAHVVLAGAVQDHFLGALRADPSTAHRS